MELFELYTILIFWSCVRFEREVRKTKKDKHIFLPFGESFWMVMIKDQMITSCSDGPLKSSLDSYHKHYLNDNTPTNKVIRSLERIFC